MSKKSVKATVRVIDHDVAAPPRPDDLARLSAPLTPVLTAELDGAQRYLQVGADELLLAALGRTIARTIESGVVPVEIMGYGGFPVACTTLRQASATKALRTMHRTLAVRPTPEVATPPEILFSYVPRLPAAAYRQALPTQGHALELRTYRASGQLQMDWWYDTRRLDEWTVEELTEQFPLALIELTSEAAPLVGEPSEMPLAAFS